MLGEVVKKRAQRLNLEGPIATEGFLPGVKVITTTERGVFHKK